MKKDDQYYQEKAYINAVIMTSPKRREYTDALMQKFSDMAEAEEFDFIDYTFIEDDGGGEGATGVRAWLEVADPSKSDWSLVIQDDAIISDRFYWNLHNLLKHAPNCPISLYAGSVRPMEGLVARAVAQARVHHLDFMIHDDLLWGVGLLVPTYMVKDMINTVDTDEYQNLLYDRRLGAYFKKKDIPIYYTLPSLVDHNFTIPSITGHDTDKRARKAVWYDPGLVTEWHWGNYVDIRNQ